MKYPHDTAHEIKKLMERAVSPIPDLHREIKDLIGPAATSVAPDYGREIRDLMGPTGSSGVPDPQHKIDELLGQVAAPGAQKQSIIDHSIAQAASSLGQGSEINELASREAQRVLESSGALEAQRVLESSGALEAQEAQRLFQGFDGHLATDQTRQVQQALLGFKGERMADQVREAQRALQGLDGHLAEQVLEPQRLLQGFEGDLAADHVREALHVLQGFEGASIIDQVQEAQRALRGFDDLISAQRILQGLDVLPADRLQDLDCVRAAQRALAEQVRTLDHGAVAEQMRRVGHLAEHTRLEQATTEQARLLESSGVIGQLAGHSFEFDEILFGIDFHRAVEIGATFNYERFLNSLDASRFRETKDRASFRSAVEAGAIFDPKALQTAISDINVTALVDLRAALDYTTLDSLRATFGNTALNGLKAVVGQCISDLKYDNPATKKELKKNKNLKESRKVTAITDNETEIAERLQELCVEIKLLRMDKIFTESHIRDMEQQSDTNRFWAVLGIILALFQIWQNSVQ